MKDKKYSKNRENYKILSDEKIMSWTIYHPKQKTLLKIQQW